MGPVTFDDAVARIISEYGLSFLVFIIPMFLMIFFREAIGNRVGGWWFKRKGYYHEDQYVTVDGEFGYIAYIGNYETKFYVYEINDQREICGKWGYKVLNNDLRKHKIKVLIANARIPGKPESLNV